MKHLYKAALLATVILCLSNSSCSKDTIEGIKTAEFNSLFELSLNENIILPKIKKELMITLTKINDSRCPADVQCIWAGNASIKLKISADSNSVVSKELCLGQCDTKFKTSDSTQIRIKDMNYSIVLKAVDPYPGKGNSEKKKAMLVVQKL